MGVHVPSVTTRGRRDDDGDHYAHVSRSEFAELARAQEFLVVAEYGGHWYGVRTKDAEAARAAELPPILTLTPAAAGAFLRHQNRGRWRWRGVFLDAPDAVLDDRLAGRGTPLDGARLAQRAVDRAGTGELPVVDNVGSLDATLRTVIRVLGLGVGGARP